MGYTIDFTKGVVILLCAMIFIVGLATTIVYISDSYDDSTEVYYITDPCELSCMDLHKEHLHTRYMDSGDECYCMENNESIRIW